MKNFIVILIIMISCCVVWGLYSWSPTVEKTAAQTVDPVEQKKYDRDKSVTEEKYERLRKESRELKEAIKNAIATHYSKSKIRSESLGDPANAAVGRKGQTDCEVTWKNGSEIYSIEATFLFNPEEAANSHRRGISSISVGEFFRAPDFVGQPSVIVKNVNYHKLTTDVGIHFVKGRLNISAYLRNHKKTADQNEKNLIEFIRAIYPVLNAKLTFEEV